MYPVTMYVRSMGLKRIDRRVRTAALLLAVVLMLAGASAAAEPAYPGDGTALYKSYPYGNFAADAIRAAGGSDMAVIDNDTVRKLASGADAPLARASLSESELRELLEQAAACVETDSRLEAVVSRQDELGSFLQISGFFLRYDPSAPVGSRVASIENPEGGSWTAYPVTLTAPESVIRSLNIGYSAVSHGARQALADYLSGEDDADRSTARIKVMGTIDGNLVSNFPRWLVIVLPLAAALLVFQLIHRNQKWKNTRGVFLRRWT